MMKRRILITGDVESAGLRGLELFDVCHLKAPRSEGEIIEHLGGTWGYIVGGPEYLSREILQANRDLREVVVMGTGTTSFVDTEVAAALGIRVSNTPALNSNVVADFAVATAILVTANTFASVEGVRQGTSWLQRPRPPLSTLKIGIVGMGKIGLRVGRRLRNLGVQGIAYTSRSRKLAAEVELDMRFMALEDLVRNVDVLFLHLTYSHATHALVNGSILEHANSALKILNFSHPNIVCPRALRNFLETREDGFCFVDGYYDEWIKNLGAEDDTHGLLRLGASRFVATSHIAALESGVIGQIAQRALDILLERALEVQSGAIGPGGGPEK